MMCFARGTCESLVSEGRVVTLQLRPDGDPGFWWPIAETPPVSAERKNVLVAPDLLVFRGIPVVVHFDGGLVDAVSRVVAEMRAADERDRNVAALRLLLERELAVLGFVPS